MKTGMPVNRNRDLTFPIGVCSSIGAASVWGCGTDRVHKEKSDAAIGEAVPLARKTLLYENKLIRRNV
jgi:hypothetical protein